MFDISNLLLFTFVIGAATLLFAHAFHLREGFQAGKPGVRCGVDLPSCSGGTYCMNGFCQGTAPPTLPPNDLPVYP